MEDLGKINPNGAKMAKKVSQKWGVERRCCTDVLMLMAI